MIYNKFDIVKVPFPFTDKQTVKRRPALIISSGEYQMNYNKSKRNDLYNKNKIVYSRFLKAL